MQGRVLVIDQDVLFCRRLQMRLAQDGLSVVSQRAAIRGTARLFEARVFDVLVSRLDTAEGERPLAVSGATSGLEAVFQPPFDVELLVRAVHSSLVRADAGPAPVLEGSETGLLGSSPVMREARRTLEQLSDSEATVLICGETGTGKELAAHVLHAKSRRASGPFVAINCAALPEHLLESELFGHTRGAFTDARNKRDGLLSHANGGTLFLDEVGELPLGLQPRLLRALQERSVRPVGSNTEVPFNARLVTATHRNLKAEVEAGRFREDLYYRLDVVQVELPALRDRKGDVQLLARHFLRVACRSAGRRLRGISPQAMALLEEWTWPGNVRELQNCVERAATLCNGDYVTPADLPSRVKGRPTGFPAPAPVLSPPARPAAEPFEFAPLAEVERRHILAVLEALGGNKTAAAQVLQVDRRTLYRKLEKFAAELPRGTPQPPGAPASPGAPKWLGEPTG